MDLEVFGTIDIVSFLQNLLLEKCDKVYDLKKKLAFSYQVMKLILFTQAYGQSKVNRF